MNINTKNIKQGMVTRSIYKFYVTAILIILSLTFIFPFLWLIITSLKPIEQTMQMPPEWIPRAYYININKEKIIIKKLETVTEPSVFIKVLDGPEKGEEKLVRVTDVINGKIKTEVQIADIVEEKWIDIKVLAKVPSGYIKVIEKLEQEKFEKKPRLFYVSEDKIFTEIKFEWKNYKKALVAVPFLKYLINTMILCFFGVIGVLVSNSLVAYAFSKLEWKGRDAIFIITLATMMIPFPVTMIPLYSVFKNLGMTGTLMPLWVPTFFGAAFNIFLLRQFYMTIPNDIIEAARIDGCSEFKIFWLIMLPLSKPVLAVCALFHFMYAWNDFMGPLIYLTDQNTFTLSLGLQFFQSQHGGTEWNLLMAASTMVIMPILILFFLTQKTFVEGITMTGMKG